jgi:hypothetical protein
MPLTKVEEEKKVHAGQHEICRQDGCPLKGKPIKMDKLTEHLATHKDLQVEPAPVVVETSTAEANTHCQCREHHPDFADRGGGCAAGQSVDCTRDLPTS